MDMDSEATDVPLELLYTQVPATASVVSGTVISVMAAACRPCLWGFASTRSLSHRDHVPGNRNPPRHGRPVLTCLVVHPEAGRIGQTKTGRSKAC